MWPLNPGPNINLSTPRGHSPPAHVVTDRVDLISNVLPIDDGMTTGSRQQTGQAVHGRRFSGAFNAE